MKSCFLSFLYLMNTQKRQITKIITIMIIMIIRTVRLIVESFSLFESLVVSEQPSSLIWVIEVASKENSLPSTRNSNSIAEPSGSATSSLREVKISPHSSGIVLLIIMK